MAVNSTADSTALPFGIRDIKLSPYTDGAGAKVGGDAFDLPNARTLSFTEAEDFEELRGDDRTVTSRGKGPQVEWELEAGGLSLKAYHTFAGGEVLVEGVPGARTTTYRKYGKSVRPWFRTEGQSISDSGGDIHCLLYRCRTSDDIEGEFGEGEFFLTASSGLALPLLDEDEDILYDFVYNEVVTPIAAPTADA